MEKQRAAAEASPIAHSGNNRRDQIASRIRSAGTSVYPAASNAVGTRKEIHRNILLRVENRHVQTKTVRYKEPVINRIHQAYVKRIERPAWFAGRIVLRYWNDIDQGIAVVLGGAAHWRVPDIPASARQHKQRGKKNAKQNSRSHRTPSLPSIFQPLFSKTCKRERLIAPREVC